MMDQVHIMYPVPQGFPGNEEERAWEKVRLLVST